MKAIALLVAHEKEGTSNAITESRECLRTTFDAAFVLLEDIETPLAVTVGRMPPSADQTLLDRRS